MNAKLLHTVERHQFQDHLRHNRTRQGRFDAEMLHLGHPLPGGGRVLEPSDRGKGAAAIIDAAEVTPLWQKLWTRAYADLSPTGKRIVKALEADWRSRPAARLAGVSQPTVDTWKKNLKIHFAQCFRAWKRDFALP